MSYYFSGLSDSIQEITKKVQAINAMITSKDETVFGKIIDKLSELSSTINKFDIKPGSKYYNYVTDLKINVNKALQALDPTKDHERLEKIKELSTLEDNLALIGVSGLLLSLILLALITKD